MAALTFSIYFSKKGSLSSEMQKVTHDAEVSDYASPEHQALAESTAPATPKRKITVEDDDEVTPTP